MVKEKLEPEVLKIIEYIKEKKNFLLSGGEGSGKTYSLVQIIKQVNKFSHFRDSMYYLYKCSCKRNRTKNFV